MNFGGPLLNLDLLSVGISVAGIGILGFAVFFNNKKSITNQAFLDFALAAIFWSISNYLLYKFESQDLTIFIARFHMFFAVWYSFMIFHLFLVFPADKFVFPKKYKSIILPVVILTSFLTLTPFVLSQVTDVSIGEVAVIKPGPAIAVFGLVVVGLILSGIIILFRKMRNQPKENKAQFRFVLIGVAVTFSLHIAFNFLLPIVFSNPSFVPYGAVFTFPFVAFTSYAIFRHHLLSVKVITTEILSFVLAIAMLFEVILSENAVTLILRSGVFCLVLGFCILLIKSVLKEVEQREQLQKLSEELAEKNSQLEELSKFKSDMLSLASHDIKRPLATIKGFASILMEGLYGPVNDKVKETLKKIIVSDDDLINTINTILDLRRIEQGYKFEPAKIRAIIETVTNELKSAAAEKKLELTFTSQVDPTVNADQEKIKHAIQNLIDNAIKYTPQGFVKVELIEKDGSAQISVIDSGLGIPATLLPKLFEEQFVRDERVKKEIRGTGLGLHLTGKIIQAHAGKIWAESDGEGKGSRFYIQLRKIA